MNVVMLWLREAAWLVVCLVVCLVVWLVVRDWVAVVLRLVKGRRGEGRWGGGTKHPPPDTTHRPASRGM